MAHSFTAVDVVIISTIVYLLFAFQDHRRRRGHPYPPGPKRWPIIGNLLNSPKQSPWIEYAEMAKKHGDILYFEVFGQAVVVLCSVSAIKDLLEKRWEIYSDRPYWPVQQIMGMGWLLSNAKVRGRWREDRKLADRGLSPGAISLNRQCIEEQTRWFLRQLLANPVDFRGHIELFQAKVLMSFVYGYELKENDNVLATTEQLSQVVGRFFYPEAALVNFLPSLRKIPSWVPWFSYEPLARLGRELGQRMMNEPIDFVKKAMRDGTAVPSLAREQLLAVESMNDPERQRQEELIKRVLGSLSIGTIDSTASTLTSIFVALALYPKVQKRAQAQIDSVISRDRLPTFEDKLRLPYVEAFCKELLRWQVVTPRGVPHMSAEDSVYRGSFIPKGSVLLTNVWAILHDPDLYPDPETFKPERFLDEDGTFQNDPTISLAFGVGKRICPGRHFVEATLFVVVASVLSVFNVTKAKDENGHEIPVSSAMQVGATSIRPVEFECSLTPRDTVSEDLITNNVLA